MAAVISALGIAVTVLAKMLKRRTEQRDDARESADHAVEVIIQDEEISADADARLAEAIRQLNDGELPDELLDPNEGWRDD